MDYGGWVLQPSGSVTLYYSIYAVHRGSTYTFEGPGYLYWYLILSRGKKCVGYSYSVYGVLCSLLVLYFCFFVSPVGVLPSFWSEVYSGLFLVSLFFVPVPVGLYEQNLLLSHHYGVYLNVHNHHRHFRLSDVIVTRVLGSTKTLVCSNEAIYYKVGQESTVDPNLL